MSPSPAEPKPPLAAAGKRARRRTERIAIAALIAILLLLAGIVSLTVVRSYRDAGTQVDETNRVAAASQLSDQIGVIDRLEDRYEEQPSSAVRQRVDKVELKFDNALATLRAANPKSESALASWLEPRLRTFFESTRHQFNYEDSGLAAPTQAAEDEASELLARMDHRVEHEIEAQLGDATAQVASERDAAVPLLWASLAVTTVALLLAGVAGRFLRKRRNAAELDSQLEIDRARRDERRVRESEGRLREAQRLARLGSWELDPESGHIEASAEALRLYGLDTEDFDGRIDSMLSKIDPNDRESVANRFADSGRFDDHGRTRTEHRIVTPDGSVRTLEVHGQLVTRPDGTTRIAETSQDVSERRMTEQAVRAMEHAEQANRAKNAFLSRMSHELRTPLHAVLGYGQMVAESEDLAPQARDDAGQIITAGNHLLKLIDEVLEISRIDEEGITAEIEPVNLWAVADEAEGIVRPGGTKAGVSITIEGPDDEPHALGDARLLQQVILNLLSNAVKYNRPGGEARVLFEPRGALVRVSVTDTGFGIPAEMHDRLFVPFDRLGADGGAVPGTGLGLAHSQRLCEEMGTSLHFESEVGVGTRFWFDLPVAGGDRSEEPLDAAPLLLREAV